MKKLFILPFLTLLSFASEPDWTRTNYCPAGDLTEVEKILNSMTIEEKVGQVIMADLDFVKPSDLKKYPLGGILNGGNTSPRGKLKSTPAEWKSLAQEFHDESIGRGGAAIPVLWGTDAVHGHSNVYGATIFPHNIGLGATQNTELLESIGQAVAEEVLATGLFWTFAPTVTVPQDYRWGRTYEGYSESPELVARLGKAFVYGLQGSGDDFLNNNKVDLLTVGQYLSPSIGHLPVKRFVTPKKFDDYRDFAQNLNFKNVASGPLVRSSYHAEKQSLNIFKK